MRPKIKVKSLIQPVIDHADDNQCNNVFRKGDGSIEVRLLNGNIVVVTTDGMHMAASPSSTISGNSSSSSSVDSLSAVSPSIHGSTSGSLNVKIHWNELTVGEIIGSGTQGLVYKVEHTKAQSTYAMKVMMLTPSVRNKTIQQELSRVLDSHPNIVSSYEAYFAENTLRILMEFMDLGTLQDLVNKFGPLPPEVLCCITQQILRGFARLHEMNIVHRDFKPDNVLLNRSGEVKISDFGMSTLLQEKPAETVLGAQGYMAPERVRAEGHDAKSDIWSIGVTVAQCALGVFPFISTKFSDEESGGNPFVTPMNRFDLSISIAQGEAKIDFDAVTEKVLIYLPNRRPPVIPTELQEFVQTCLTADPKVRPSCVELLSSPFISKYQGLVDFRQWLQQNHPGLQQRPKE